LLCVSASFPPLIFYSCSSGFLSRLTFTWVRPLLKLGTQRQLKMEDLFQLPPECSVDKSASDFQTALQAENARDRARTGPDGSPAPWTEAAPKKAQGFSLPSLPTMPPVFHALWKVFGPDFITAGFYKFGNDCVQFMPSVMLSNFLQAIGGKNTHILARFGPVSECAPALAAAADPRPGRRPAPGPPARPERRPAAAAGRGRR